MKKIFTLLCLCVLCIGSAWGEGKYVKVTSASDLTDGNYLIVNEGAGRAFNGLDVASGYVNVVISNGEIADANGAAIVEIKAMTGGYSLKITNGDKAGNYIYGKSGSNSLQYGATAVASTITFTDGAAKIENNSTYFCYNATSGQDRFRFYKSTTTGANYIIPALYKESTTPTPPSSNTLSSIAVSGPTTSFYVGDEFKFGGTVTASYVETDAEDANVTNKATFSGYDMNTTGEQTVTVSYTENEVTKTTTYKITVNAIPEKTIAEFISSEGGKCYLTGIVSNIKNTTFGNFDLTDESGTIYVYGCLTPAGEKQKFNTLDVVAGDKIKVLADKYTVYNETKEAVDVIFVEEIAIEKAKYVVTINTPTNGTLVVKDGENAITSGNEIEEGTVLTIEATPADGYKLRNWQAVDETTHTYTTTFTYTIAQSAVTISANFDPIPTYTINYMVNGVNTDAQENVYEDTPLVFPTVDEIGGKVFVGWSEAEVAETNTKPTLVETTDLTASESITYYAVFAAAGGTEAVWNKVTNSNDLNENDVIAIVSSEEVSYNIKGDKTEYTGYIALGKTQNSNNRAGEVVTVSDGVLTMNENVQQITLTKGTFNEDTDWQLGVDGGFLYACNSSSNYLRTQETNNVNGLWNISITDGKATIFAKYSSYTRNYLRVNGNYANSTTNAPLVAAYAQNSTTGVLASIYKKTGGVTYSNYCTTVTPQTQDVEITSAGYATAYIPFAATVEGATAYYVTVDGAYAKLNEISGTIPANTGVVLKGEAGTATFTESSETPASVEGNLLIGTAAAEGANYAEDNTTYYILSTGSNGVGFYWDPASTAGEKANCAQYKAVLAVSNTTGAAPRFFSFDEATGIEAIHNAQSTMQNTQYNLNGVRVNENYKGIVIINGKKVVK